MDNWQLWIALTCVFAAALALLRRIAAVGRGGCGSCGGCGKSGGDAPLLSIGGGKPDAREPADRARH